MGRTLEEILAQEDPEVVAAAQARAADMLLPKGWKMCRLGDVLTLINGRAYKRHEMLSNGYPILRIQNLNGGENWFYSDMELPEDKYCTKGDLLYAWSATFGPYWSRWEEKIIYHYHIWKVEPSSSMIKEFAFYELWRITEDLKASAHGVAMPHITKTNMENWEVMLPPLAEQKVIADKLDSLLVQVETTKARLDRIPDILKRFRQSVLAAAVSGRLTEDWRAKKDLTISPITELGSLIESSFYGPRFSKNDYTVEESGVPTIRTTDMDAGKIIISPETPRVIVPEKKLELFKVERDDLLITRTGSIGVMAVFDGNYVAIPSAYLIRFRFKSELALPKYIYFALTSPDGQRQMGLGTTAITQPNINAKSIRAITIVIPSLEEQTEIVHRVEQLFTYADTIEQQVQTATERVNNLTQSILAKAFRGELTADWRAANPDLISGDNSAEALLEKIKAEREAMKPKKKTRTKKVKV